ncbi:MAG: helix-turn-helix transcriptional regulator [Acidobacteriota bacterium]
MNAEILNLRDWRQSRGITLDSIAESTKLSVRQLRAIETGAFRELPGGIYTTNYIRQYARAIDFDEARLLAFYHETCQAVSKEPGKASTRTLSRALLQI